MGRWKVGVLADRLVFQIHVGDPQDVRTAQVVNETVRGLLGSVHRSCERAALAADLADSQESVMRVWPGQPYPLGANWGGAGVNFALFSEHATKVELCLFDDREDTRE